MELYLAVQKTLQTALLPEPFTASTQSVARCTALKQRSNLFCYETGSFYRIVDSAVSWNTALAEASSTLLNGVSGGLSHRFGGENYWFELAGALGHDVWIGAPIRLPKATGLVRRHEWTIFSERAAAGTRMNGLK